MRFEAPAPTVSAKSARMRSNISLEIAVETFQTVRPVFGLDKARHIEPFEPMMACGDRPLADRRPYSPRDRLQAKAMFVHRPELDFGVRVLALLVGDGRLELFLSAARSSSSAASGWRGRGCWSE